MKNWIKEHTDTLLIMATLVGGVWTIKGDIHALDNRLTTQIHDVDKRLTVIETVMILQGHPIKSLMAEADKLD